MNQDMGFAQESRGCQREIFLWFRFRNSSVSVRRGFYERIG